MSKQVIQLGRSKAMSQFSHTTVLPYCSLALPAHTGPVFQEKAFGLPALRMNRLSPPPAYLIAPVSMT